ncbi:response regulator transcription factor [Roseinatronobacter monicus]|uniref:LuxR family two component transcriptional regulator n=1 Tax=Roseinatronobacter monicus TaxID=393481 RepID=A0A543K9U5_9RHOB|nr:response regulator transcription factor [Roseinatronobacter monicus]TQM91814.1 LuxR family two component transcriptional regulator [Roseinatronobacter monicus]
MRETMITMDAVTTERGEMILVIDDHPLFCEALQITLSEALGLAQIETRSSLGAALDAFRAGLEVDAIILDLNLPDVAGLDGLARLRNAAPGVPVIVVSSMSEARIITAVLHAGAAGFVPKHSPREDFVAAIRVVSQGGSYLPQDYAPPTKDTQQDAERNAIDRLSDLTPQQGRILALVCEGYLNKQIAYELSISETTVKAHVTAILRKLGAQSRTQAVRIANSASYAEILREKPKG